MIRPGDDATVHLWPVCLDDAAGRADASVLGDDERRRADRFLRHADRERFVRGHVALRAILARYLDCAPQAVAFTTGPYGKPGIAGAALQFSFSHSHELAVVAVAHADVGVDVEYTERPLPQLDGMIAMVCHPQERAALGALASDARAAAFYRLWTRKEAYCKALGVGLRRDLTAIRFEDDGKVADGAATAAQPWYVVSDAWSPLYALSLCTPKPCRYKVFQW